MVCYYCMLSFNLLMQVGLDMKAASSFIHNPYVLIECIYQSVCLYFKSPYSPLRDSTGMKGQSNESMCVPTVSPGYGGSPYAPAGDGKSSGKYGELLVYAAFQSNVQFHQ